MKIQLIIPILNPHESFFTELIPALIGQTVRADILIINSGDPIPTGEYEVITIDKKDFNHANTRNLALGYEVDFYLFMTQDAIPYNTYLLENLLQPFDDPDVVVSYARQIPYPNAHPIEVFARETNYPALSKIKSKNDLPVLGIKTFFSSDSCAMYRGDYFKVLGGFTQDLNTNEDMEFATRSILDEKKVAYCAGAKVVHSHNFSLRQIWARYREIGNFFSINRWILDEASQYKAAESTGINQAIQELKYLSKYAPLSLPRSIAISFVKYVAFKSSF